MSNLEQFRENFTGSQSQRERSQHITEKDARDELGISYLLALPRNLVLSVAREKALREAAEIEVSEMFKAATSELLEEDEPESVAELLAALAPEEEARDGAMVCIFPEATIASVKAREKHGDTGDRARIKSLVDSMSLNGGWRRLAAAPNFGVLRDEFPNFKEAIDALEASFALASAMSPGDRSVPPILLDGLPGIGKTMFAERLAELMSVAIEKTNIGTAQGAFELVGTSSHWSNTKPGRVHQALSNGDHANPVLLLDEIDKMGRDVYSASIEPAMLDLLETRTAALFRDDCLSAPFNASHVIIICTSNDAERISAPVLSRLEVMHIEPPTKFHRLQIAQNIVWKEISKLPQSQRPTALEYAVSQLAESDMSPREMTRTVRKTLGRCIVQQYSEIIAFDIGERGAEKQKMGFV